MYSADEFAVPFVILGTYEEMARDTFWEEHSHPTHELLWNERGASTATVGSRTWTVTSAVGLWIPAGVPHTGWMPAGTASRAAQFSVRASSAIADGPVAVDITQILRLLLDRLCTEELSQSARASTEAVVLDVLAPTDRDLSLRVPKSIRLAPIVETIMSRPDDATTLEQWASRLDMSARTVTRLFRDETGLGFSKWVAAARAHHASALLARGDDIDDIAAAVGFGSSSAFATAFRRVTGMTPGRFRVL